MKLSLTQAAERMGKTVRQVRYLVQTGKLRARKGGGRWIIETADLPLSEGQTRAQQRKAQRLRDVVEQSLDLPPAGNGPKRYSVVDIKAFQLCRPVHDQARDLLGPEHEAVAALRSCLDLLAVGCHRFDAAEKAESYRQARDHASRAVCALLLVKDPPVDPLVETIEQEVMRAIAGLLRRLDRGRLRRRRRDGP